MRGLSLARSRVKSSVRSLSSMVRLMLPWWWMVRHSRHHLLENFLEQLIMRSRSFRLVGEVLTLLVDVPKSNATTNDGKGVMAFWWRCLLILQLPLWPLHPPQHHGHLPALNHVNSTNSLIHLSIKDTLPIARSTNSQHQRYTYCEI